MATDKEKRNKWKSEQRPAFLAEGRARSDGLPPPAGVEFMHHDDDKNKVRVVGSQQIKSPSPVDMLEFHNNGGDENVLMAHPEASQIFTRNYNHRDPYLSDETVRMDDTYVSPELQRRRTKYGTRY